MNNSVIDWPATRANIISRGMSIRGWLRSRGVCRNLETGSKIIAGNYPSSGGKVFLCVVGKLREEGLLVEGDTGRSAA